MPLTNSLSRLHGDRRPVEHDFDGTFANSVCLPIPVFGWSGGSSAGPPPGTHADGAFLRAAYSLRTATVRACLMTSLNISRCATTGPELQQAIATFGPDIVSTIDTPTVVAVAQQFAPGAKLIYEVHTPYAANQKYLLDHDIVGHVAGLIVPTQSQGELVEEFLVLPCPVRVVPNFLPESFFDTEESEEPPHTRPIIVWVGRLDELKNWRAFTEIAMRVSEKSEAEFWLIGAGMSAPQAEKDELERLHWTRAAGRTLPLAATSSTQRDGTHLTARPVRVAVWCRLHGLSHSGLRCWRLWPWAAR